MNAAEFWDVYFRQGFLRLKRQDDRWRGEFRTDSNSKPRMLAPVPREAFEIPLRALSAYAYADDGRFAIPEGLSLSVSEAFHAVMESRYPYREAAPFGRDRMRELFAALSNRFGLRAGPELRLGSIEGTLQTLLADARGESMQSLVALIWLIGERRERATSGLLIDVLRRCQNGQPSRLHFTAEEAAFTAFWKVNDKTRLPELLQMMDESGTTGRWKHARLLERLLSTDELLSVWREGDAYADPKHWRSLIEPMGGFRGEDWDAYDRKSAFWELRYLSAVRQPRHAAERLNGTRIIGRTDREFAAICAR